MSYETTKTPLSSRVLFRLGQALFMVGFCCFLIGVTTSHWVDRPIINITARQVTSKVTLHYGVFTACLQISDSGEKGNCDAVTEHLKYVDEHASKFVQALMIISCLLFGAGFILEIFQILPLRDYRNFIAQNRMVEMFAGIAAVVALGGIVVYAGEVKNKAERVAGQDEENVGWSFVMAVTGLGVNMLGIMTVLMFRDLPIQKPGEKGGSWMKF